MLRFLLEGTNGLQRFSGLRQLAAGCSRVGSGRLPASRCLGSVRLCGGVASAVFSRRQGAVLGAVGRSLVSNRGVEEVSLKYQKRLHSTITAAKPADEGTLIYTGNLAKAVLGVKFFSYSTTMFSLCVMPYVFLKTGTGVQGLALQVAFCSIVGVFTFLTPVLLHLITRGYVVRLYHNADTDTYTAVTYSALLLEKKTVFHQQEVKIPSVSRMFTSFYANQKSLLVNPMSFPLPHDYNHLMGYDKPFMFDMDELPDQDKGKQS
ncbi:transmembrane protein 70, mitochondrial [Lepisosteus oculatus]|uniref:Transmembrane protein 70 n=1 Tax=Lepisosteus oculatus TaxID=7918 RepID=W5M7J1_LEPOC|nr:PREDICTED: transmembrane protein 70, mitochondrial [Lepisosteus oculatus]